MNNTTEKYLEDAKRSEPDGIICHFCHLPNDWADDCGWFYIVDPNEPEKRENGHRVNPSYPACKFCYDKHSWKNIELYGLGDR